mgnify:CR=1 FL=1
MRNKEKILITGASGCVGQYTANWLLENSNADLILWLRDPSKLTAINQNHPRIKLIVSDLRNADLHKEELNTVNRVIHTATAWGDPDRAYQVNVVAVKQLIELLNPDHIKQIIYFSTASILDKHLNPLPEALEYGTEYIQTKAQCLEQLESHPLAEKIIAVFPTLVFGGRIDNMTSYPRSYLTEGLSEAVKWLWLARWFKAYSTFHFIHAQDIAEICGLLATRPHESNKENGQGVLRRIVLAQPSLSIDQAVNTLLKWRGIRQTPRLPLWGWLVEALIRFLPLEINEWDRFSIKQRHFVHTPITPPERLGGNSYARNLEEILMKSGLKSFNTRQNQAKIKKSTKTHS